jgi:hypothetical protein
MTQVGRWHIKLYIHQEGRDPPTNREIS